VIVCQEHRDQLRNLEDARAKLADLIAAALVAPTPRRPTRPTAASRERRLGAKSERAQRKRERRRYDD
jgi:ribosome-associated protein